VFDLRLVVPSLDLVWVWMLAAVTSEPDLDGSFEGSFLFLNVRLEMAFDSDTLSTSSLSTIWELGWEFKF